MTSNDFIYYKKNLLQLVLIYVKIIGRPIAYEMDRLDALAASLKNANTPLIMGTDREILYTIKHMINVVYT